MTKPRKLHELQGTINLCLPGQLVQKSEKPCPRKLIATKNIFLNLKKELEDEATFEARSLKDVPPQFRQIAKRNYKPLKGERKALTLSRAIHPGEILKEELLIPRDISQAELARSIKVSVRRINDICQGKRGITPDTALLAKLLLSFDPKREYFQDGKMPDTVEGEGYEPPTIDLRAYYHGAIVYPIYRDFFSFYQDDDRMANKELSDFYQKLLGHIVKE
ncbi:7235_t:CDS:2, partial [Racocetra persica]